ncbi:DegT/DnrJ/EryC1/StrS family aminotransferase [Niabella aquatica]
MSPTITIPYENLKVLNQSFEDSFRIKFNEFISRGWYILGQEVQIFENAFASWHNIPFAVGVASGLDALILPLKNHNFPAGSEVLVPSNTYIATILSIVHCGLVPVLVEPDILTYNIDSKIVEKYITKKTVALMIVHLYGQCCEMNPLLTLSEKYDLLVIEDCAQAHGARYKGQLAGTFGQYGAFSFYPTKNLGALGDAGAILCKTPGHAEQLKKLRNYGSGVKYYNEVVGYNSRLDEIQAAFLNIKLNYLNDINEHKRKLADIYFENLDSRYILPYRHEDYFNVYHIFNIRHKERDRLKDFLAANGIGTEIHYPEPPHYQKALRSVLKGQRFPVSEEIHKTTLSLPCSYAHSPQDIYRVVEVLNRFE